MACAMNCKNRKGAVGILGRLQGSIPLVTPEVLRSSTLDPS